MSTRVFWRIFKGDGTRERKEEEEEEVLLLLPPF
jgi:hypothetical protein